MNRKPPHRSPSRIEDIQDTVTLRTLPAGGDAFAIIPQSLQNKNHLSDENRERIQKQSEHFSESNQRVSQCPLLKLSSNLSNSILESENQLDLLSVKSCGFPYYRSYKSCGRFDDIVLVKDAEVSCTILNPQPESSKNLGRGSSILRGLMLNRMKIDCKNLGDITRKISSCTKDVIKNFSLKKNNKDKKLISSTLLSKKELNSSYDMHPVAIQYTDKTGSPCLKLRLVKLTKFSPLFGVEKLSCWNISGSNVESEVEIDIKNEKSKPIIHETIGKTSRRDEMMRKHSSGDRKNEISYYKCMKTGNRDHVKSNTGLQNVKQQMRQLYPKGQERVELGSSSCSNSSSICDFLMMRNEKTLVNGMTKNLNMIYSISGPSKSLACRKHASLVPFIKD